jgi:hypothetical protein
MRTITIEQEHLRICCQPSPGGVKERLTSNLERNSSIAALSPDKNWGAILRGRNDGSEAVKRCVERHSYNDTVGGMVGHVSVA